MTGGPAGIGAVGIGLAAGAAAAGRVFSRDADHDEVLEARERRREDG